MYELQAIISNREAFENLDGFNAAVVILPKGKAMIPLTVDVRDVIGIPFIQFINNSSDTLPLPLISLCELVSSHGRAAYVEAEFWGGMGAQACVLWEKGVISGAPHVEPHAINYALNFLGVIKGSSIDEFEALNLGECRDVEDWIRKNAS